MTEARAEEETLEGFDAEASVNVILLDLKLPGIDGFEVCRRLRKLFDVPILTITVYCAPEQKLRAFGAGADDIWRIHSEFGNCSIEFTR